MLSVASHVDNTCYWCTLTVVREHCGGTLTALERALYQVDLDTVEVVSQSAPPLISEPLCQVTVNEEKVRIRVTITETHYIYTFEVPHHGVPMNESVGLVVYHILKYIRNGEEESQAFDRVVAGQMFSSVSTSPSFTVMLVVNESPSQKSNQAMWSRIESSFSQRSTILGIWADDEMPTLPVSSCEMEEVD